MSEENGDQMALEILNDDDDDLALASKTERSVSNSDSPSDKTVYREWDWIEEPEKRIEFFKRFQQFKYLAATSKDYVETLRRTHEDGWNGLWRIKYDIENVDNERQEVALEFQRVKQRFENLETEIRKTERQLEEARRELQVTEQQLGSAKQKLEDADADYVTHSHNQNEAIDGFQRTFMEHDQVYKQLRNVFYALEQYELQEETIRQPNLLPFDKDILGQTYLPSTVWEVPLLKGITETIDLKSLSHEKRWEIKANGTDKWHITDIEIRKTIILVRRFDQKIQVEWTDDIKNFEPSVNDERSYALVITHTIDAENKMFWQRDYPLFAFNNVRAKSAIPVPIATIPVPIK